MKGRSTGVHSRSYRYITKLEEIQENNGEYAEYEELFRRISVEGKKMSSLDKEILHKKVVDFMMDRLSSSVLVECSIRLLYCLRSKTILPSDLLDGLDRGDVLDVYSTYLLMRVSMNGGSTCGACDSVFTTLSTVNTADIQLLLPKEEILLLVEKGLYTERIFPFSFCLLVSVLLIYPEVQNVLKIFFRSEEHYLKKIRLSYGLLERKGEYTDAFLSSIENLCVFIGDEDGCLSRESSLLFLQCKRKYFSGDLPQRKNISSLDHYLRDVYLHLSFEVKNQIRSILKESKKSFSYFISSLFPFVVFNDLFISQKTIRSILSDECNEEESISISTTHKNIYRLFDLSFTHIYSSEKDLSHLWLDRCSHSTCICMEI